MSRNKKIMFLAMMVALDVVLSPLMRIEGMAPMSSTINVIAAMLMGPVYGVAMAFLTAILRMTLLAGIGARITKNIYGAMIGEFIGTGLIGSLLSYPVMVWFTGTTTGLFWFVYTPRFCGGAIIGSTIAWLVWVKLKNVSTIQRIQKLFAPTKECPLCKKF